MRNYREISKDNIFVRNANKIRDYSFEQSADIKKSIDMYIADNGIFRTKELMKKAKEFIRYCDEDGILTIIKGMK